MGAGPVGTDAHRPLETGVFHLIHELQERTGWGILLGAVVDFPSPCAVTRFPGKQPRGHRNQAEKNVHSDREVGTPNQPGAAFADHLFDVIHPIGPARRPDYQVDPQPGDPLDILDSRGGDGKVYGDINALKVGWRNSFEVRIVELVELKSRMEAEL